MLSEVDRSSIDLSIERLSSYILCSGQNESIGYVAIHRELIESS